MEKKQTSAPAPRLDLGQLVRLCFKSWKTFVACIAGCLVLAGLYMLLKKPAYEVNAQLMLPPETGAGGGILALSDLASSFSMGDMFGGSSTENEISVIRSQTVFENTARALGLNTVYKEKEGFMNWNVAYLKPKLNLSCMPSISDTLRSPMVFEVEKRSNGNFDITVKYKKKDILEKENVALPAVLSTNLGDFTLSKTENFDKGEPVSKFNIFFSSYSYIAQVYVESVKVFAPNKKTDFITLSYITPDTKFGKLLLNTIIEQYNLVGIGQKNDKSGANLKFVDDRIASLEKELAQAETDMEKFKEANNITDPMVDASALIQKSSVLEGQLLQAQTENEILQLTLDFLSNPANNYSLIPVMGSGVASAEDAAPSNVAAYNNLILERMKVQTTVKTTSPTLKLLDEQIDMMRQNIITSLKRTLANSDVKLKDLKRENTLTSSRMGSIPKIEREYIGLERDLILKQQLYLFLLKQREEAQMSLDKSSPSLLTIDPPYTLNDTPGLSNKLLLAIALFLGFCLALAWVFYVRLPKAPLPKASALQEGSKAPSFGVISKAPDALPVLQGDQGESIRALRSNIIPVLEQCEGNAVMVTSARKGEGKTFVATNLALALALADKQVALVDANMRDPEDASIVNPGMAKGLTVVPINDNGANPADVLSAQSTLDMLIGLKEKYQYVVIDTPAVELYSDAFSVAEAADLTLFVSRIDVTTPADIEMANSILEEGRLPRMASVANS